MVGRDAPHHRHLADERGRRRRALQPDSVQHQRRVPLHPGRCAATRPVDRLRGAAQPQPRRSGHPASQLGRQPRTRQPAGLPAHAARRGARPRQIRLLEKPVRHADGRGALRRCGQRSGTHARAQSLWHSRCGNQGADAGVGAEDEDQRAG